MVISQGDIYWIDLREPIGSEPGYSRPHVVIQNDIFNASKLNTIVVCTVTSQLRRAEAPGNVLLSPGEANLPKQSVVLVSQLFSVGRSQLGEFVGKLSRRRVNQILDGVHLLLDPRNVD